MVTRHEPLSMKLDYKASFAANIGLCAAELNSSALHTLTGKLTAAKAPVIGVLKTFGLNRLFVNHPTSPEKWHVGATSD